jgi:hypothetical protein
VAFHGMRPPLTGKCHLPSPLKHLFSPSTHFCLPPILHRTSFYTRYPDFVFHHSYHTHCFMHPSRSDKNLHAARARRTNGATQTFRRPSHTTTPSGSTTQAHSRDTSGATTSQVLNPSGAYVPPHAQSGKSSHAVDGRYSRGQLLEIYRDRKDSQDLKADISNLYVGAWEPNLSNGAGGPVWGRRDDHGSQSQIGVDMCWDKDGSIAPLALTDMTELEREVSEWLPTASGSYC